MKYIVKKVWASAILSILIMVTAVTTTYARYVMTYNNDIDDLNFNINGSNSVFVSTDGVNFSASLSKTELIRCILRDKGYYTDGMSDSHVESVFANMSLEPVTPLDYKDLSKGFGTLDNSISDSYYSFELYVTTDRIGTPQSINITSGGIFSETFIPYDLTYFNVGGLHPTLGNINRKMYIDVANALRIGMTKSVVTDIGDLTDVRNGDDVIYTEGTEDAVRWGEYYSFGGIHVEDNVALNYYNNLSGTNLTVPETDRQDIEIRNNQIISTSDGLIEGKMIKLKFYIWLEGWDPDCFDIMIGSPFRFSLGLTTYGNI